MPRPTFQKWAAPGNDVGTLGGYCLPWTAGATLLIGDSVFLSAAAAVVNKSATTGDHLKTVGIVVGGKQFSDQTSQDILDVGETAALVNEKVFVAFMGFAYAVTDTTAILVGSYVAPSIITSGRVRLATVTTDAVAGDTGKILGYSLDANGSVNGTKIRVALFRI